MSLGQTSAAGHLVSQEDRLPKRTFLTAITGFIKQKPLGAAGGLIVLAEVLVALLAPVLAPYDPEQIGVAPKFSGPGRDALLGTDQLGRDVLSRLIYGARVSMYVGLLSVGIGITLGTLIGIFSAYSGGVVDLVVQRMVDALMGFLPIILDLGLMAALGADKNNVVIALVVVLLPGAVRVVRSQVLSIKELD